MLIRATHSNQEPLPFGVEVLDMNDQVVGLVGQGRQLFVRGGEEGGDLLVR
ncbi:FimD/PapC C-terminal domain-containing protein [Dyella sp. C9]|uniref:FimD/PapC C-terminal domain-containing protein n=1 Tax=Dyella sp. C9 TaxID=2202154 RepID=UPI0021017203|nr:FimD/PapC C-terminal domain-containing protein [Dyella sp. C9]